MRKGGVIRSWLNGAAALLRQFGSNLQFALEYSLSAMQASRGGAIIEGSARGTQIASMAEKQITMAQKQITLSETERAHAQAVYDMQTSRFTGQALYNWLAGSLSALYYQMYDVTLPVCLQAKAALVQELGSGYSYTLFRTPVWDDLWQGGQAGEALKLDNAWTSQAARGLEATRTVSLVCSMVRRSAPRTLRRTASFSASVTAPSAPNWICPLWR